MKPDERIEALEQTVRELQDKVIRLERVIDGFGDLLRPKSPSGHPRLTRWMRD
jgi:hypothetical protein